LAQLSARRIAMKALRAWQKGNRFADSMISQSLDDADLTRPDRAFVLELFYGVLRNLTLLDFWISCVRASRIDDNVRHILRWACTSFSCWKQLNMQRCSKRWRLRQRGNEA
jgi:hypothetical protein